MAEARSLHELRRELASRAPFLGQLASMSSGWPELDQRLGGWPRGGITLLTGPAGSGRLSLAAGLLAQRTQQGEVVAFVDGSASAHPPALWQRGVILERTLMIRREDERVVYGFEQIVASGIFSAVVGFGLDPWLTPPRWRRLQSATEGAGVGTVLVTSPETAASISGAALRLDLEPSQTEVRVAVRKDRSGRASGQSFPLAGMHGALSGFRRTLGSPGAFRSD
ncbi:MAG: hypothetical protein AAGD10_07990 [Myxococcota bacterium]